jgi:beta-xylosidase
MSSNGGTTTPGGASRLRHGRALAWGALGVVALAGLVGAVAASTSASASRTTVADASHRSAVFDATAPPAATVPSAPGTEVPAGLEESDPFVTVADGRYVLLTSGGTGADPVNVPVTTSSDFTHWTPVVDALPVLPAWADRGFTWAPDLHRFGSTYALYFTAQVAGRTPQTQCIGSAFGPSPTGPFTASPTPFVCQLDQGGTIDPRVFVDHTGTPWLLFKSDQNIDGATTPTVMWSEQLSADGTSLVGSPHRLLSPDRPWQGTIVEAPDMVEVGGAYWVVYSANWYNSPDYAVGAARCAGPAGPCADVGPSPLLASNLQGDGPGEASVFRDPTGIWLLYSPRRSAAPQPDVPPRPVYVARIGFDGAGPYLASGPLPGPADLLTVPFWSTGS